MTMIPEPPVDLLRELIDDRALFVMLSVDQYHRMIETGVLPEGAPYELLGGNLLRKDRSAAGEDLMTVGHEHATSIRKLTDLNARLRRLKCHIQIQLPLTLPPWDEPEPDAAIILGDYADYTARHPGAADVTCVIEVADNSLRRDRTIKSRVYAAASIAQYVTINLPDRVVEVYTQPLDGKGGPARYGRMATLTGRQALELPAAGGKRLRVTARSLLP